MDNNLDDVIGDVAKEMTAVPADARFAERVSTRIAEAGDRRARWSRPWILVPVASACALVLAVVVGRHGSVRLKPDATTKTAPGIAKVEQRGPHVERAFQARGDGDPERVAPQIAMLPDLPPPVIAPIEVDRLSVQPIVEMSAIDISPIAIDRIEISAMP
jgi:hypothetical protein